MTEQMLPRNRAERRAAMRGKGRRAAGAALTAGSAALAMTAGVLASAPAAHAAGNYNVTASTDDGTGAAGTLSAAINSANLDPGSTINFAVPGGNIDITGDLPKITASVSILGPGPSALTIDGQGSNALFYFDGAGTSTISGLTLTGGEAVGHGGAINANDTNLTVDNDVITGNKTGGAGRDGGGVSAYNSASLVLSNSTVTGNTADDNGGGAALYNVGSVSVSNTSITGNHANGSNFSDGGGLYVYGEDTTGGGGTVSIDSSVISGNDATDNGGGVYITATKGAAISNTTISGNTELSQSGSHGGGGVMLDDLYGDVSISNSSITGNSAPSGGGVYAEEVFGSVAITGSSVSGNQATDGWGGGLYLYWTGAVTVTQSTIADNTASAGAGGVNAVLGYYGSATVLDSTISGNSDAGDGGGWWQVYTAGETNFFNSTISGNTAGGNGGGIWFYGYGGLSAVQSTIADNTAANGAGLFMPVPDQLQAAAAHVHARTQSQEVNDRANAKGLGVRSGRVHPAAGSRAHAAAADEATSTGSIIAGNHGADVEEAGTLAASHSLLGTVTGTTLVDNGGNLMGVDPMLGPLASNGGPTQTMALLAGSPAIDTGPIPVPDFPMNEFDQRGDGFARVVNGQVDIGAFEVQPEVPVTPPPVFIQPKFTG